MSYILEDPWGIFSLMLVIIFFVMCFFPLHCFYMTARKSLGLTLFNILVTPMFEVRFRHFFLADVITSMGTPIKDATYLTCFFLFGFWKDS